MSDDDISRRLARLDTTGTSGWGDPRAIVRKRRTVRGAIAAGVVVVAAAALVVVPRLGSDGSSSPTPPLAALQGPVRQTGTLGSAVQLAAQLAPLRTAAPSAVSTVAKAEQDFTADLLKQLPDSTNASTSPASLAIALAMLQNGAAGPTESEIASALGTGSVPAATQDEGWAGLTTQWTSAAKAAGIDFSSANSVWQQRGLALRKGFMSALARYYASGVWQVDYAGHNADALAAMNEWTSQHTHGKITKLFDSLSPDTVLVLANAVYFKAAWQTPFDVSDTMPGPFTTQDGSHATAQFMQSQAMYAAATTSDYAAAQLPYRGGRFAALVVMPRSGSLASFVDGLSGTKLASIASSLSSRSAVALPKFTTTSSTDLNPVLQALGVRTAFTSHADFSKLSPTALQLSQTIQRVYLKVGEKGTEAAAVTGLGMIPSSARVTPQTITFDHPFLFLVRDTQTGAVLFASRIVTPVGS